MPLYLCQPPTGYDDTAATWVSSGALVSRMNFALAVADGRLRGSRSVRPTSRVDSRATLLSTRSPARRRQHDRDHRQGRASSRPSRCTRLAGVSAEIAIRRTDPQRLLKCDPKSEPYDVSTSLPEIRRDGDGDDGVRPVVSGSHGGGNHVAAEAADRDLPARRRRRPQHGRPVWRGRLLSRAAEHRHRQAGRGRRRHRSQRLLRTAPADGAVQAALGSR